MHLGLLGYMLTIADMDAIGGLKSQLKNLNVMVDTVQTIKESIPNYSSCTIEDFRDNGYCRKGDTGLFISQSVRDFISNKTLDANEEGLLLILYFEGRQDPKINPGENLNILLRNQGLDEAAANSVLKFVNNLHTINKPGIYLKKIQ